MNKKSWIVILIILLTVAIITIAIIFASKEEKTYEYDTHTFKNITINQALGLFEKQDAFILITVVIVTVAIIFAKKEQEETYEYDTHTFNNINVKQALLLFDKPDAFLLFIGRQNCEGCSEQGPYIILSQIYHNFDVYHIDLEKVDFEDPKTYDFVKKLDYPYELYDQKGTFGGFIGYTPMVIIIKNGKQVYGNIGVLTDDEITKLVKTYGVKTNEED